MNSSSKSLISQVDWYQKQGYRVTNSESSAWVEFARGIYQAFPFHWVINPSEGEIINLLKKNRLIALRYSTLLACSGQISYHVSFDKSSYELSSLSKKARHDVVRGLEHASYEIIPLTRLAFEGWDLRYETLVRQGRRNAETREFWEKLCLSAEGLPGFEAWGAIHNGQLVAALLSYLLEDTVSILYQQSKTDHLRYGVNNALTYVFTHTVLQRPRIRCIFYGLHSLDAPPSVDQFKFRMGYAPKPVRQRVVFNPLLQPLVNHFSLSLIQKAHNIWPYHSTINKAEGMVRFYLAGKRLLPEQCWPEALKEQKDVLQAQISDVYLHAPIWI